MADADPAPGAPTNEPAPGAPAPTNSPAPGASAVDPDAPVDIDKLPANVQNMIKGLRSEAANARTSAKSKAADQARTELMQQVSQALGLSEPAADPQQLSDQLASTQLAEAEARVELVVFRTAQRLGADADRLLDSRAFVEQVNDLPDEQFDTKLQELIRSRLESDPSLRSGGGGAPTTGSRPVEALRSGGAPAAGDTPADMNEWMRGRTGRK